MEKDEHTKKEVKRDMLEGFYGKPGYLYCRPYGDKSDIWENCLSGDKVRIVKSDDGYCEVQEIEDENKGETI